MADRVFFNAGRIAMLFLAMCVALAARAECTRVINVPLSAIGLSVIVSGSTVSGVYPDVLRELAVKGGCGFAFSVVPRARLEAMFEAGDADLLIPATRTPRRDQQGQFVPLIFTRPTLISVVSDRPPIQSIQQLLERRELRIALVRGFDYGSAYQALIQELGKQGRLLLAVDAQAIARLMDAGVVDATLMAPSILAGAVLNDGRSRGLLPRLRYEPLAELPWGDSGAYISKRSVGPADAAALRELLDHSVKSGALWKSFQHYYPQEVLNGSLRPRGQ